MVTEIESEVHKMKEFVFEVSFEGYTEQYTTFAPNWTIARNILDNIISNSFLGQPVKDITYIDTRPVVM